MTCERGGGSKIADFLFLRTPSVVISVVRELVMEFNYWKHSFLISNKLGKSCNTRCISDFLSCDFKRTKVTILAAVNLCAELESY